MTGHAGGYYELWLLLGPLCDKDVPNPLKGIIQRLSTSSSPVVPHIRLTGFALADAAALQAKLDWVVEAVDAWKHEEICRHEEHDLPVLGANGQVILTADLKPLMIPNPYYEPDGWAPEPFKLKFIAVMSDPTSGKVWIELESSIEYRSLLGAIVAGPSPYTVRGHSRWSSSFLTFRDPRHFKVDSPEIVLRGPGPGATPNVVEHLKAAGSIVEGRRIEVGGVTEVEVDTLALVRGGEEGWTEVAKMSLDGDDDE